MLSLGIKMQAIRESRLSYYVPLNCEIVGFNDDECRNTKKELCHG